jgi:hypothetical protein
MEVMMKTKRRRFHFLRLGAHFIIIGLLGFIVSLIVPPMHKVVQAQKYPAPAPAPAPVRKPAPMPLPAPAPAPALSFPETSKALAPATLGAVNIPPTAGSVGDIQMTLKMRKVRINEPFSIVVWFEPSEKNFSESVEIFMDETDGNIKYVPNSFTLKPYERKNVEARVIQFEPRYVTIDTGFSAKFKAANLDKPIESGSTRSIVLEFVNNEGKFIYLDAPIKVTLQSSNTKFYKQSDGSWVDKIEFDIREGQRCTPAIQIQPKSWSMDAGMITAEAGINRDNVALGQVVSNQNISFVILPPWWLSLLMALIGGVLHGMYQATREIFALKKPPSEQLFKIGWRIPCGALAGVLSYLFVDWDIIGIKIDTTSLKGFVILGFLFSYVGIDLVLKNIFSGKKSSD